MGYRPSAVPLELEDFQTGDLDTSLLVKVIAPTVKEGALINAGRATRVVNGEEVTETSDEYARRCMGYMIPKIKFWNLETEDGEPVPLPSSVGRDIADPDERLQAQLDHLYEQDENVVLAIYGEWRLVGYKKAQRDKDSAEGKDSGAQSTNGHSASPPPLTVQELESQIPM